MKFQITKVFLISIILTLSLSCSENSNPANTKATIDQIMDTQENAWNQGDIDGFMNAYWESDELAFVGSKGLTKGYSGVLSNYKKTYPNKEKMGTLEFVNKEMRPLGDDYFFVVGQWTLFRTVDTLQGHYSLVWENQDGKWVIINDHSS